MIDLMIDIVHLLFSLYLCGHGLNVLFVPCTESNLRVRVGSSRSKSPVRGDTSPTGSTAVLRSPSTISRRISTSSSRPESPLLDAPEPISANPPTGARSLLAKLEATATTSLDSAAWDTIIGNNDGNLDGTATGTSGNNKSAVAAAAAVAAFKHRSRRTGGTGAASAATARMTNSHVHMDDWLEAAAVDTIHASLESAKGELYEVLEGLTKVLSDGDRHDSDPRRPRSAPSGARGSRSSTSALPGLVVGEGINYGDYVIERELAALREEDNMPLNSSVAPPQDSSSSTTRASLNAILAEIDERVAHTAATSFASNTTPHAQLPKFVLAGSEASHSAEISPTEPVASPKPSAFVKKNLKPQAATNQPIVVGRTLLEEVDAFAARPMDEVDENKTPLTGRDHVKALLASLNNGDSLEGWKALFLTKSGSVNEEMLKTKVDLVLDRLVEYLVKYFEIRVSTGAFIVPGAMATSAGARMLARSGGSSKSLTRVASTTSLASYTSMRRMSSTTSFVKENEGGSQREHPHPAAAAAAMSQSYYEEALSKQRQWGSTMKRKLETTLDELRTTDTDVSVLKGQLKRVEETAKAQRAAYLKDILILRELLFRKTELGEEVEDYGSFFMNVTAPGLAGASDWNPQSAHLAGTMELDGTVKSGGATLTSRATEGSGAGGAGGLNGDLTPTDQAALRAMYQAKFKRLLESEKKRLHLQYKEGVTAMEAEIAVKEKALLEENAELKRELGARTAELREREEELASKEATLHVKNTAVTAMLRQKEREAQEAMDAEREAFHEAQDALKSQMMLENESNLAEASEISEATIAELRKDAAVLKQHLASKDEEILSLGKELEETKIALADRDMDVARLNDEIEALKQALADERRRLETNDLAKALRDAEEARSAALFEVRSTKIDLAGAMRDKEELEREVAEMSATNSVLLEDLANLKKDLDVKSREHELSLDKIERDAASRLKLAARQSNKDIKAVKKMTDKEANKLIGDKEKKITELTEALSKERRSHHAALAKLRVKNEELTTEVSLLEKTLERAGGEKAVRATSAPLGRARSSSTASLRSAMSGKAKRPKSALGLSSGRGSTTSLASAMSRKSGRVSAPPAVVVTDDGGDELMVDGEVARRPDGAGGDYDDEYENTQRRSTSPGDFQGGVNGGEDEDDDFSVRPEDPADWKLGHVLNWAEENDIPAYVVELLASNHVNGRALLQLSNNSLRTDLGVASFGHRSAVVAAVDALRKKTTWDWAAVIRGPPASPLPASPVNGGSSNLAHRVSAVTEQAWRENEALAKNDAWQVNWEVLTAKAAAEQVVRKKKVLRDRVMAIPNPLERRAVIRQLGVFDRMELRTRIILQRAQERRNRLEAERRANLEKTLQAVHLIVKEEEEAGDLDGATVVSSSGPVSGWTPIEVAGEPRAEELVLPEDASVREGPEVEVAIPDSSWAGRAQFLPSAMRKEVAVVAAAARQAAFEARQDRPESGRSAGAYHGGGRVLRPRSAPMSAGVSIGGATYATPRSGGRQWSELIVESQVTPRPPQSGRSAAPSSGRSNRSSIASSPGMTPRGVYTPRTVSTPRGMRVGGGGTLLPKRPLTASGRISGLNAKEEAEMMLEYIRSPRHQRQLLSARRSGEVIRGGNVLSARPVRVVRSSRS